MLIEEKTYKNYRFVTITNNDFSVTLCNLGASIYSIKFNEDFLTLTTKNFDDFFKSSHYHGKTIGRVANRFKGNILTINNNVFLLENNENENVLHGGNNGLSNQIFSYQIIQYQDECEVRFHYLSLSGESGYPGDLDLTVIYVINIDNSITIKYEYNANQITPISLTNHTFFTLGNSSINGLKLFIDSKKYLHPNPLSLLAEEIKEVSDEMDFSSFKNIGKDIDADYLQNSKTKGYDHYYFFNQNDEKIIQVALKNNNYILEAHTSFPGLQIYSDNYEDDVNYFGTNLSFHRAIALEFSLPHDKLYLIKQNQKYIHFIKLDFLRVK